MLRSRHKLLNWLDSRLRIIFQSWRSAAKRKGLLKYDDDNESRYVDYFTREDASIADRQLILNGLSENEKFSTELDELGMLRLCHCVAAADHLRLENAEVLDDEQADAARRLEDAVQDVIVNDAASAIASGARVECSQIRRMMSRITADHAPFFSLLLSHCPAYSAKVISSQSMEDDLYRCVSPLNVIILKTHIDRWKRAEITSRELKTLLTEATPIISSRALSVSQWRDTVRLALEKEHRRKAELAAQQGKRVNHVYREALENFLHPILLGPYADAPTADIKGQLDAIEALTSTMRNMALQSRVSTRERDLNLLKRGIERTCRVNYIDLKEILASQRGVLNESMKVAFDKERAEVQNINRTIEERLVLSKEDFETRVLGHFSNMFVETCNLVPPLTRISSDSIAYKARLWALFSHQTFVRVLKFVLRNFNVRSARIPDDIFSLGSGVIANWLIHSFLQNQNDFISPSQVQSSAFVLWNCFPPGWWNPARINSSMLEELSWIDNAKRLKKCEIDLKTDVISRLSHQIVTMKSFMKKVQKELGVIGKKAQSKRQKDSKVLDSVTSAIASIKKRLLSVTKTKEKLEAQVRNCEMLYKDGRIEEAVHASGVSVDASKKETMRAVDYQIYLKAFAFDCIEILKKREVETLELIENLKNKRDRIVEELEMAKQKTFSTTMLIRNLAKDKFNKLIDTRELMNKKQREIDDLSNEIQAIKAKDSLVSSYDQSIRSTSAFLSTQLIGNFVEPKIEKSVIRRPRNPIRKNILQENDIDVPAIILSSMDFNISALESKSTVDTVDFTGNPSSQNVQEFNDVTDAVVMSEIANEEESIQTASSTDMFDEESEESLKFGQSPKSSITIIASEEDIAEGVVREMVFNEYWSLVGGRYVEEVREKEPDVALLLKRGSQLDLSAVDRIRPPRKKLAFDKNKLAAYRDAAEEDSDSEDEPERQIPKVEKFSTIEEANISSWLSNPIDVRLMSVSMSQDAELELLDARLVPQRNVKTDIRSATRMSFSGSGLNFKNGDPFVLAGLARLTRITEIDSALVELDEVKGFHEAADPPEDYAKDNSNLTAAIAENVEQSEYMSNLQFLEFTTSPVSSRRSIASSHPDFQPVGKPQTPSRASAPAIFPIVDTPSEELKGISPLLDDTLSIEADLDLIRTKLDEDAKMADVTHPLEVKCDLMLPPSEEERQIFRTRKKKTETLRHGPESSRPYVQRLIRRTNPLRRSQSSSLQIAVLQFQEEAELGNYLKVESVRLSRDFSKKSRKLSIPAENMNDDSKLSPHDWMATSRATTAETQPVASKIGAVISSDSIESSISAEFPTVKIREAEDYRPRYPNLSILVRAEAMKMKSMASERIGDGIVDSQDESNTFTLTDELLEHCIANVRLRLELNGMAAPRQRFVLSRGITNLTLHSTFSRGRLASRVTSPSSSFEFSRAEINSSRHGVNAVRKISSPKPSAVFMPPVSKNTKCSAKPLPGLFRKFPAESMLSSDLALNSSSVNIAKLKSANEQNQIYRGIDLSDLVDSNDKVAELSSLGFAYAAILGLHPNDKIFDEHSIYRDDAQQASLVFSSGSDRPKSPPQADKPPFLAEEFERQTDAESAATGPSSSTDCGEILPIGVLDSLSTAVTSGEPSLNSDQDFELAMDQELRELYRNTRSSKFKIKSNPPLLRRKAAAGGLTVTGTQMQNSQARK